MRLSTLLAALGTYRPSVSPALVRMLGSFVLLKFILSELYIFGTYCMSLGKRGTSAQVKFTLGLASIATGFEMCGEHGGSMV